MAIHKLIMIDDARLAVMAANPAIVKEFPFLAALVAAPRKPGCGRCGSRAADLSAVFRAAKAAVAGLAPAQKNRLKALLNAHRARVVYVAGKGRPTEVTF